MNAEYAGFFDIGMVERNEEDAIAAHGTMLMARLSAMHEVGDWTTYTIVEDSELGLRLFDMPILIMTQPQSVPSNFMASRRIRRVRHSGQLRRSSFSQRQIFLQSFLPDWHPH